MIMTKLICPHCHNEMVDLGWGVTVCPEHPANKYPIQLQETYVGYTKMYKVIKINKIEKKKLVCELCGRIEEISFEQLEAISNGVDLINNSFPDGITVTIHDILNKLFETVDCSHDFKLMEKVG